jgi:predicted dehydrogenase
MPDAVEFCRRHGGTPIGCWEDLVSSDDVDVVFVCTPPDSHAAIAIAALEAGKHVLCEKPLARTSEEARRMVQVATQTGLVLKCGFNHRHHPALALLKQRLADGDLGQPLVLRCTYGIAGRPGYEREWRCDPQVVSGGHLVEQGIHAIDLAAWLLGPVVEVTGATGTFVWDMAPLEDNAIALLRCRSGALAVVHASLTQWENLFRLELSCSRAVATVIGLGGSYGDERLEVAYRTAREFRSDTTTFRGADRSWAGEWREFVRLLGQREVDGGLDGQAALAVVEAVYLADASRTWVRM